LIGFLNICKRQVIARTVRHLQPGYADSMADLFIILLPDEPCNYSESWFVESTLFQTGVQFCALKSGRCLACV